MKLNRLGLDFPHPTHPLIWYDRDMKIQTQIKSKKDFREWLAKNHNTAKECWIQVKRTKPIDKDTFYYIDAIEEALCFGWIDSIHKVNNN